jgi:hypothetical protein
MSDDVKNLKPLNVSGYTPQTQSAVDLVNKNKEVEERVLRRLDELGELPHGVVDPRMYALARTGIQEAFMWLNRSIFKPTRVRLPEDE